MYIRVLSIRKHKNVSFINAYTKEYNNAQFMIDNNLLANIKCGDLINVLYMYELNSKGRNIKKITKILEIVSCNNFESGKGINKTVIDYRQREYLDARNGGFQIQILKYKRELINRIREILNSLGYLEATGLINTVEYYANGSNVREAVIENRKNNVPRYLRITLENQLKQMTALTLHSTYAIDKVFRNMGEDSSHINEFLMLELVSISNDLNKLTDFVKQIDNLSKELAEKYKIIISDKKLKIIDYKDIVDSKTEYEQLKKEFVNTIVLNFPCNSPFIKKDECDGLRKEVRWYVNGHFVSHYYSDENNMKNIDEVLEAQKLLGNNINPLSYFEWGLPSTVSLGLSIDRWLQMLLDFENIVSVANPIGLDYPQKRRKR